MFPAREVRPKLGGCREAVRFLPMQGGNEPLEKVSIGCFQTPSLYISG